MLTLVRYRLGQTLTVATLPRTVTIRDGRIGGEGRSGEEYSVVTADSFIALPVSARDDLPPGTLVRIRHEGDTYTIRHARDDEGDSSSERA
jgi:hypothetical protein